MPESLSTIAELGIGLAGFSGVVVAFGYRSQRLDPLDRLRVIALLSGSLGAALLATLPLVLADGENTPQTIWRSSSSVFAIYFAGFLVWALSSRRSLSPSDRAALHPVMWTLAIGGFVILIPILMWNAIGFHREPSAGPYLAGLYFLLFYSSAQFLRLLLVRPANAAAA